MSSSLEQLRQYSTVVVDTGDFELIAKYKPTDATTNPSLILQAVGKPQYAKMLDEAVKQGNKDTEDTLDLVSVLFGCEILKLIPGRVSTEVDARLSYDTEGSVTKALKLIKLYEERGYTRDRILIKLAATWEGIQAAKILESQHGIHCNMTLLFSLAQAAACGEAGATLISPFVGRIYDYFQVKKYDDPYRDPGVVNVTRIYNYYKKYDYKTVVMGASFRNIDEVKCLAGCDLLTISPSLLWSLDCERGQKIVKALDVAKAKAMDASQLEKIVFTENMFKVYLTMDEMAYVKLGEGIRNFIKDQIKLEQLVKAKLD